MRYIQINLLNSIYNLLVYTNVRSSINGKESLPFFRCLDISTKQDFDLWPTGGSGAKEVGLLFVRDLGLLLATRGLEI